ncbi:MAG: extracellular solute-binding protein, partial [Roseburia sp.]|nr:extracellular solute-binding protein [Roseburia sp.]
RMTNVSFDLTEVTVAESSEKTNLLLASGDYPELFFKNGFDPGRYAEEGIFIPLEDLIREYAPNLTALLDEKDAWDYLAADDGHIYVMPDVRYMDVKDTWLLSCNEVWLDNLGLDVPTTIDEWHDVLTAFKEQDANGNGDPDDEIPLVCCSDAFTISSLFAYFCTDGVLYIDDYFCMNGNEISFYPTSEEFKEVLATFTQWYEEGLIDNACFTQGYQEYMAIGKSEDQYGFIWGDKTAAVGDRCDEYIYIDPIQGSPGLAANNGLVKSGFGVTDKCENPEVAVAWCDNFYNVDVQVMCARGQEGVDWEWDEDGYIVKLDTGASVVGGTTNSPGISDTRYQNLYRRRTSTLTGEALEGADQFVERTGVVWPTSRWGEHQDERTQFSEMWGNLIPAVKNYVATVMTGEKSLDDTWDEFQAELEDMGAQEFVELYVIALGGDYVAAE